MAVEEAAELALCVLGKHKVVKVIPLTKAHCHLPLMRIPEQAAVLKRVSVVLPAQALRLRLNRNTILQKILSRIRVVRRERRASGGEKLRAMSSARRAPARRGNEHCISRRTSTPGSR